MNRDWRGQVTLPGEAGTVYFTYDPFGRRIRRVFGSATMVHAYDGDNVIEELDGGGNLLARYTQGAGIDEPLAMYRGLATAYFHADGLGSITSLTDGVGQVAASYVYDSFGKLTASTGTVTNPFQYTAREFDSETGLYHYRARYYDPMSGRFLSEDPIGMAGGMNVYRYVDSNPINGTDPSGLWSPEAHDAMIQHALGPCGICQDWIDAIKAASRFFDEVTGTDTEYANYHAMAKPGQTPQRAIDARNDIIASQLSLAQQHWTSDRSQALTDFATGIHTMMDLTSPAHTDNSGNPIMWCGLQGCKGNRSQVLQHSRNDYTTGVETTGNITRAIYAVEDDAIRGAFMYMTGNYNLSCKK